MRLGIRFAIQGTLITLEYRKGIMSFMKKAFETYDQSLFDEVYGEPQMKPYTFSVYLPIEEIVGDQIKLKDSYLFLNLSTSNAALGIKMYNALLSMRGKDFNLAGTIIQLTKISSKKERCPSQNSVKIRFLSPLLVREHNEQDNRDQYYTYGDSEFLNTFQLNLRYQLEQIAECNPSFSKLTRVQPISGRKEVVRHYGQLIDGMTGIFLLEAPLEVIRHLYQAGVGSRRSAGFGMFEIL